MFDSIDGSESNPVLLWFGQQVIAILIAPFALFAVGTLLRVLPLSADFVHNYATAIELLGTIVIAAWIGAGFTKSKSIRRAVSYAWVGPVFLFVWFFVLETTQFGLPAGLSAFFAKNVGDDETLATIFFTLPTCSSVGYSLGALLRTWNRH